MKGKHDMNTYYCVMSKYDDKGHTWAKLTGTRQSTRKPMWSHRHTKTADYWIDWFDSLQEAEKFVQDTLNA